MILPAKRLNHLLPELVLRFGEVDFYEVGWGDKGFYQAPEVTLMLGLQAFFYSSGSVMHVVAVKEPEKYFNNSQITKLCVNNAQLAGLTAFVASSFARNTANMGAVSGISNSSIMPRMAGLYGNSQFYDAVGRYHLLNTCNTWSAKALGSAGFAMNAAFKLSSDSVMQAIEANACKVTGKPAVADREK